MSDKKKLSEEMDHQFRTYEMIPDHPPAQDIMDGLWPLVGRVEAMEDGHGEGKCVAVAEYEGEREATRTMIRKHQERIEEVDKWCGRYDALVAKVRALAERYTQKDIGGMPCTITTIYRDKLRSLVATLEPEPEGQPTTPPPAESPGLCICGHPRHSHWRSLDKEGWGYYGASDYCGCRGYTPQPAEPAEPEPNPTQRKAGDACDRCHTIQPHVYDRCASPFRARPLGCLREDKK